MKEYVQKEKKCINEWFNEPYVTNEGSMEVNVCMAFAVGSIGGSINLTAGLVASLFVFVSSYQWYKHKQWFYERM